MTTTLATLHGFAWQGRRACRLEGTFPPPLTGIVPPSNRLRPVGTKNKQLPATSENRFLDMELLLERVYFQQNKHSVTYHNNIVEQKAMPCQTVEPAFWSGYEALDHKFDEAQSLFLCICYVSGCG
ncbi:hypothetical protein ABZP36_009313 [Zizania latifolia]